MIDTGQLHIRDFQSMTPNYISQRTIKTNRTRPRTSQLCPVRASIHPDGCLWSVLPPEVVVIPLGQAAAGDCVSVAYIATSDHAEVHGPDTMWTSMIFASANCKG